MTVKAMFIQHSLGENSVNEIASNLRERRGQLSVVGSFFASLLHDPFLASICKDLLHSFVVVIVV
jgi:hypothetical protein